MDEFDNSLESTAEERISELEERQGGSIQNKV